MRVTLLRHAPAITEGRIAGRRDVAAACDRPADFAWLRARIPSGRGTILCSPARRCLQTAAALDLQPTICPALWEQHHGRWEGCRHADLPDLGRLSLGDLAAYRPEGGESFEDMAARVRSLLRGLSDDTLIIAHAGTVRAALSLVVGPAALAFEVAPLSTTVLRCFETEWAVEQVNVIPCP